MPTEGETTAFSALVDQFKDLVERREDADELWFDWQTGVVGGGPDGDGRYPLRNRAGEDVLVLCPAALASQVLNMGYQAQVGFDAALTTSERFATLMMPANVRFTDNFSNNQGVLLGTAPEANLVINIRRFAANGTDLGIIGTVTVSPARAVTWNTTGAGFLDLNAGEVLALEGPATALAATQLILLFKANYRT